MTATEKLIAGIENVGEWDHKGSYYTGSDMKGIIAAILTTEMPAIIEEAERRGYEAGLDKVPVSFGYSSDAVKEHAFAAWRKDQKTGGE